MHTPRLAFPPPLLSSACRQSKGANTASPNTSNIRVIAPRRPLSPTITIPTNKPRSRVVPAIDVWDAFRSCPSPLPPSHFLRSRARLVASPPLAKLSAAATIALLQSSHSLPSKRSHEPPRQHPSILVAFLPSPPATERRSRLMARKQALITVVRSHGRYEDMATRLSQPHSKCDVSGGSDCTGSLGECKQGEDDTEIQGFPQEGQSAVGTQEQVIWTFVILDSVLSLRLVVRYGCEDGQFCLSSPTWSSVITVE